MTQEEIKQILPHRDSMLLLDEVTRDGDFACGKLKIRGDEWFLNGHFPGMPIVPGVILCEILAQSACVLLTDTMTEDKIPVYTGLDGVRFYTRAKTVTKHWYDEHSRKTAMDTWEGTVERI